MTQSLAKVGLSGVPAPPPLRSVRAGDSVIVPGGCLVAPLPACLGGSFHTTMQQRQSRRPCGSGTPLNQNAPKLFATTSTSSSNEVDHD
jgi:hypothetical protein